MLKTLRRLGVALATSALLASSFTLPSGATTASQREYKRGYNDCIKGRWDDYQHGASYKKGCRAAENKLAKMKKKKPADVCPDGVSEADRYKYPACN